MAITNAKNNYLDRLFGRTNEKLLFPEQNQGQAPAGGAAAGIGGAFNFLGSPGVNPQPNAGQAPTTTQAQPEQQVPTSRYKLYELMQSKPTRDTGQEEIIKRRAKINAIGAGFSGLAGLAGMKAGGDAPFIQDDVTPFNMQQIQTMDQDYRSRLQDWVNKGFEIDQSNTTLQNREIDKTIDFENQIARIQQQGANAQELAAQRAQYALQQLQAKTEAEQIKEMMGLGIDPYSKDAYQQYLNANKRKYEADVNYTKARTNWNNRIASGSGAGATGKAPQYGMSTLKKGRDAKISQLEEQLKQYSSDPKAAYDQNIQGQVKFIQDQIKELRNFNPGKNELMDAELAELGIQLEEQSGGANPQPQSVSTGAQRGPAVPFDPQRGFTNVPKEQDPILKERITQGLQLIENNEASDEDFEMILQDIVDAGEAEDLDAAFQLVYKLLKGNQPIIPPN
jgi:hypothetical protein